MSKHVPATIIPSITDEDAVNTPGAFKYMSDLAGTRIAGMIYRCPCGCGVLGALLFRPADPPHPSWEWDGNHDTPTLAPSVHRSRGCGWHGHLRGGVWEEC